ncbi:hypothetical protein GCM10010278_40460 [Streptomyces melanogenes]|nr:hypothetical protein GCM10010278_40460 [Streptomyces melanogenes]
MDPSGVRGSRARGVRTTWTCALPGTVTRAHPRTEHCPFRRTRTAYETLPYAVRNTAAARTRHTAPPP